MSTFLAETLSALSVALARNEHRWFLFGAQAAMLYGARRLTHDVDVTVFAADLAMLIANLRAEGFETRTPDPHEFATQTRVLPVTHAATGMPVDVVLGGPGFEEHFWEHRQTTVVAGVEVPVVQREHLVLLKLLAGRPHDLDDARAVIAAGADRAALAKLVEAVVEALGESDVRDRLNQVLDAV